MTTQEYTKFERARIIGARALQISANAPILLKMSPEELEKINYDPITISEREFDAGILPITVNRPMPRRMEKVEIEEVAELVDEIETGEVAEKGKDKKGKAKPEDEKEKEEKAKAVDAEADAEDEIADEFEKLEDGEVEETPEAVGGEGD
jgi:DNA-directed RNA polymerase subunit K